MSRRVQMTALIKFAHGGARPGAGRKPKPLLPFAISYATDTPRWFCIRTEHGAETAVDVAIRKEGFETFFPMCWVPPVAAHVTSSGRAIQATSERLVPLLRSYALARFDRSDPSWRRIASLRGVERIFGTSPEWPTPIPDSQISKLREGLGANGVLYPPKQTETDSGKKRWTDMATALLRFVETSDA